MTDEPQIPDEYARALGLLAIVSSTVDHVLALMLMLCEGKPLGTYDGTAPRRADRKRNLRRAVRARRGRGEMDEAMATFALSWSESALDVLHERDKIVHALWRVDPFTNSLEVWHRHGAVANSEAEIMEIVDTARALVLEWTVERQIDFRRLEARGS